MADVAIIYARENRGVVQLLDTVLTEQGWSVWWDADLSGEGITKAIQAELSSAGCIVVLWSHHSVHKDWVLEEARFVKEQHRPLVQVKVENAVIPIGFGQDEFFDLIGWSGEVSHEGLERLIDRIARHVGTPTRAQWDGKRKLSLSLGTKTLSIPAFFRSASSHETQLRPDAALRALELTNTEAVLASAYDLSGAKYRKQMKALLKRMKRRDTVVILDSGNYEAYRTHDATWTKSAFRKTLVSDCCDYAFCYDNLKPSASTRVNIQDTVSRVERDQTYSETCRVLPIVHIPLRKGQFHTVAAPDLFQGIANALKPELIAVPERELGSGVIEKARVIAAIRAALNELGWYQPIHLLGTGNPLSLAIFAAAGADTFDGLEWCRTATDHETGLLYHFQQYDFFRHQTRSASNPVVRIAADAPGVSYNARVAFHNLEFLRIWINDLQKDITHSRIDRLLRDFLPKGFFRELSRALPGGFDQ